MSGSPLKLGIQAYFDAISDGDYDRAVSVFAEDAVLAFPGLEPLEGRRRIAWLLRRIRRRFTELRWTCESERLTGAGLLFARWEVEGMWRSGAPYRNKGVSIVQYGPDRLVQRAEDYFTSASGNAGTDFRDPGLE